MARGLSLLRIVKELSELCNAHGQVRTYKHGLFLDVIKEASIEYTLAHTYIRQAPTTDNSTGYLIELSVMAKVNNKTDANDKYVQSNTKEIWDDLFNAIQYSERWQAMGVVDGTAIPTMFEHKGADRVTGWGGTIPFVVEGDAGFCKAPIFGYDFGVVDVGGGDCDPATYENSDASFTQSIAPGGTYVAPDVNNVDSDGTVVPTPANTVFTCTPFSTTVYDRPTPAFSGNVTSVVLYDEGWHYLNGTYDYGVQQGTLQRLDMSSTTLDLLIDDNTFGNKNRFTDENGLQVYGGDLTIDHLTGLMYKRTAMSNANHANRCLNAQNSTEGGFTDWRVANDPEIMSVLINQTNRVFNRPPYFINGGNFCSVSLTAVSTVHEWRLGITLGAVNQSTTRASFIVRTIY